MPDCYDATIKFPAGVVTEAELQERSRASATSQSTTDGIVRIDGYIAWGEFTAPEAFLCKSEIPFDRNAEGCSEALPYVHRYRPDKCGGRAPRIPIGCLWFPSAASWRPPALAWMPCIASSPSIRGLRPLREWLATHEWQRVLQGQ